MGGTNECQGGGFENHEEKANGFVEAQLPCNSGKFVPLSCGCELTNSLTKFTKNLQVHQEERRIARSEEPESRTTQFPSSESAVSGEATSCRLSG